MEKTTQTGFTLYELLITVLVVGVVLAYGIPNMSEFRQNSRMASTANDLHSSFYLARSEASRAKANVTICSTTDSSVAVPTCGGEFENGWVVFEDTDGDVVVDAGEAVLKRYPAIADGITIDSEDVAGVDVTGIDYFSFAPTGQGRGDVAATGSEAVSRMILCDARGNQRAAGGHAAGRVVFVTPLGRATVLREEDQLAFHGGC